MADYIVLKGDRSPLAFVYEQGREEDLLSRKPRLTPGQDFVVLRDVQGSYEEAETAAAAYFGNDYEEQGDINRWAQAAKEEQDRLHGG